MASMTQAYQPLHHKYRPQRLSELVGQGAIASTLGNALRTGRIAPAYLFSGPRGTGKTSSARILARSLNCVGSEGPTPEPCGRCELCTSIAAGNALDVIEIDAASNTGVDNIRELIERSRFAPVQARWKVYVIDECHMLSTAAFNALLKTLEEPPPRVVFVLATTDPQRVLPTILSRCQRFDFRRIPLDALEKHLAWIAEQEGIGITPEALQVVAQRAQGGLRDAESLLDQLSLLPPPVEPQAVWELLGAVPEQELLQLARAMAAGEPLGVVEACRDLMDRGREPGAVLQGLAALLRDLLLAGVAPDRLELTSVSPSLRPELPEVARAIGKTRLLHWQAQLKGSEQQLRLSVQARLWLEVLLLGLLAESQSGNGPIQSAPMGAGMAPAPTSQAAAAAAARATSAGSSPSAGEAAHGSGSGLAAAPQPAISSGQGEASAPVPPAAPAAAEVAMAQPPPSTNLPELWQQILAGLELASTRMLLTQQAHLHRLDHQRAVVRVSSNWMAMVQSRLPLLEKAVSKALGSPRTITLEASDQREPPAAADSTPAVSPPVLEPTPAPARPSNPALNEAARPEAARTAEPPASTATAMAAPTAMAPASVEPATRDADPTAAAASPPTAGESEPVKRASPPGEASAGPPQARSRIEEKARQFADFFNGEVISPEDA
jgi:DNA polymerase-3 subunit gamma/tau